MKQCKAVWCLVCAVLIAAASRSSAADFSSWARKLPVIFQGYSRPETLTNYPALVLLSTNLPGFAYKDVRSPTGGDLRFAASNAVWVQVPFLSGTSAVIWAYWDNPSQTNAPAYTTNGATWADGYVGVWHLTQPNARDSTSNRFDGVAHGNTNATGAALTGGVATQFLVSHRRRSPADPRIRACRPRTFDPQSRPMDLSARTEGL